MNFKKIDNLIKYLQLSDGWFLMNIKKYLKINV